MDALFGFFQNFQYHPLLAIIPAMLLAALGLASSSKTVWAIAMLWGAYCLYELGIFNGLLCDDTCIRVDLLFIAPLLTGLTIVAVIRGLYRLQTG